MAHAQVARQQEERRRIEHLLAVARGDEAADLVLRGGRVLSVHTREWLDGDVAIAGGHVAGLGFALSVIPELKVTDRGLVDVVAGSVVPLEV